MLRKETTEALVRRVLGDEAFSFSVVHYLVAEYVSPDGGCRVVLTLETSNGREVVEGQGSGFVDAAYKGLMHHHARAYSSLASLTFTGFTIRGQMETGERAGLDAEVEVELCVRTLHGRTLAFRARDRSTLAAAVAAIVQVVEHFINAERAYVKLHRCLADAEARHRPDLIEEYTTGLAHLVEAQSFETISARVRRG
jgi:hypothetical protein